MFARVKVVAGAKKERVEVVEQDTLHIEVREPKKENRANTRVRELVAQHYKVKVESVRIVSGHHTPSKRISILDNKKI